MGEEVFVIDNLRSGKEENINENAKFYKLDINSSEIEQVFLEVRPDIVFHFAAQVSVSQSIKFPLLDEETNIRGLLNILDNCSKYQVSKFVFASSAAVYGIPVQNPITEDHVTNPISFYGVSKLASEYYIKVYNKLFGLKYSILRYSNVYGPRQDHLGEGGVISIFINKIIQHESPIIYGSGEQTRDFIFVQDVVSANVAAMKSPHSGTYNISTQKSISLNQLVSLMSRYQPVEINPSFEKEREGDILHSCLDNTLATKELRWRSSFSLDEGLEKTLRYYGRKIELFN